MTDTIVRVLLFLGYKDERDKIIYTFYRQPKYQKKYRDAESGKTFTLINSNVQSALPRQVLVDSIARDESKNERIIYLLANSEKEVNAIVESDPRWETVLEGNP